MSNGQSVIMSSVILRDLFECISVLTSKDTAENSSATDLQLASILQQKIETVHRIIDLKLSLKSLFEEDAPSIFVPLGGAYTHVLYLEHCLACLNTLVTLLRETNTRGSGHPFGAPGLSPSALSISQQQCVQCLLQFIVGLGIHPNLLPGVGVASKIQKSGEHLTPCRRHRVLVSTVKTLLNCADVVPLWDLVVHKHLVDLLAALFQLCHAPIKKTAAEDLKHDVPPSDVPFSLRFLIEKCREEDVPDAELITEMHADRAALTRELNRLLESTFQPLLVRDLLLLMSYPTLLQRHHQLAKKTPKWLKMTCGRMLSACLLKKDGLSRVILGVVDAWSMSCSDDTPKEHDWMKYDAFARTVANVPNIEGITAEEYYKRIGPQVLEVVRRTTDHGADKVACLIAHGILGAMLESRPRLSSRWVLRDLFHPLLQCMVLEDTQPEQIHHEISENDFGTCIDLVHRISCNKHLNQALIDAVVPLLPVLYEVHVFTQGSVSYLRSLCETIISSTLASQDAALAVSILHWCVFREKPLQQCGSLQRDVTFSLGAEGGVKIKRALRTLSEDEWVEHVDKITSALRSVLEKESCKDVVIAFFLSLLKKLNTLLKRSMTVERAATSCLLETEVRSAELRSNLLLLHLVQGLSDVAAEGLPKNLEAVVAFVQETLERGLQLQREQEGSSLASQSVLFSLTILGVVLADFDLQGEGSNISSLQKCLPSLSMIANEYHDPELRSTARNLHLTIATHGAVSASSARGPASRRAPDSNSESDAKSIDPARLSRISEIAAGYGLCIEAQPYKELVVDDAERKQYGDVESESCQTEPHFRGKEATSKTPYEEMWQQLQDPLIPVRGHAFISLRKLVEQRDAETLKNRDVLLETCHAAIQEGDSYIYLSAIQALAALADENTDAVLHVVANEMVSEKLSIEARLNLGEVLLRTCRNLGEMAPKYRNLLVNCFLCATKDPDPIVRASGASNLGDLCGKLGYSFTSVAQEVLTCLRCLMKTDPENSVRRAAVLAVASLVKGMGSKLFAVIPEELRALHRELKQLYGHTSDDIARLQAQLAIEELNRVTREFLTPQPTLEKTVRVLDFPP